MSRVVFLLMVIARLPEYCVIQVIYAMMCVCVESALVGT